MTKREQEFEVVVSKTLQEIQELFLVKGKEYRRNNNPYHNFERGAEMTNFTREEILQGFLRKHLISIEDMRNDSCVGFHQSPEKINEKYNDILVYFMIEKAMMLENAEIYNTSLQKSKGVLKDLSNDDILNKDKEAAARTREGNLNEILAKNA